MASSGRRRRLYLAALGLAIVAMIAAHLLGGAAVIHAVLGVSSPGRPLLYVGVLALLAMVAFKVLLLSGAIGIGHGHWLQRTRAGGADSVDAGEGRAIMHSQASRGESELDAVPDAQTEGRVLDWGWRYDLMEWVFDRLFFRGKLRGMRMRTADLVGIRPGEAVLDVGCGTGTLALEARARVGPAGRVAGVDPGAQQIARARSKAARRGVAVDFQVGVIERLPFPDGTFDVALSTIMLHHLPEELRRRGLGELRRVLKPGGRVAIADFKGGERGSHGDPGGVGDLAALLTAAGFVRLRAEELRMPWVPAHPRVVEIVAAARE